MLISCVFLPLILHAYITHIFGRHQQHLRRGPRHRKGGGPARSSRPVGCGRSERRAVSDGIRGESVRARPPAASCDTSCMGTWYSLPGADVKVLGTDSARGAPASDRGACVGARLAGGGRPRPIASCWRGVRAPIVSAHIRARAVHSCCPRVALSAVSVSVSSVEIWGLSQSPSWVPCPEYTQRVVSRACACSLIYVTVPVRSLVRCLRIGVCCPRGRVGRRGESTRRRGAHRLWCY